MRPAEENVAKVGVEWTTNVDETKGQCVHIPKFDCLNDVTKAVICNMKQMTEVLHTFLPVNSAHNEKLEKTIRVIGFDTSYGVFGVTLCKNSTSCKIHSWFAKEFGS